MPCYNWSQDLDRLLKSLLHLFTVVHPVVYMSVLYNLDIYIYIYIMYHIVTLRKIYLVLFFILFFVSIIVIIIQKESSMLSMLFFLKGFEKKMRNV